MQPDNRPTTTPSNKASFFMFSPDQSNCITGLTAKGRDCMCGAERPGTDFLIQ